MKSPRFTYYNIMGRSSSKNHFKAGSCPPRIHTILPVQYSVVLSYRKLSRLTLRTKRTTQILCGRNAALSLVKACARRSYSCHNPGQNGCQATKRLWTQIASILQNKMWSHCSEHQCSILLYHHGLIYCAHLRPQYKKSQPHLTSAT